MSDPLTFMMGEFAAQFPIDRQYARNHMWAQRVDDSESALADQLNWRFGFTAYAVRLLQDVYFLDWIIDPNARLAEGQEIGAIESSKAESSLYAPTTGMLTVLNETLMNDPSAINVDKYGAGWLFGMQSPGDNLMSPVEYLEHLTDVWEVTQKTIKGQLNK